mmetsp:Transcript_10517/g.37047  ORF Transcript_10517/g.37047 Transcript_10517/m.37047 type:complete len:232 (+) Transcript_10517:532-1227(+)
MPEAVQNPLGAGNADAGMFSQYASEFYEVAGEAKTKLAKLTSYSDDPTKKQASLRSVEQLLKQACDLMKQIDIEVRSAETQQRKALTERARPMRDSLRKLQEDFRSISEQSDREGLLGNSGSINGASAQARGRLLDANSRAERQNDVIRGALEVAHDTEQVAIDIAGELQRNRETMTGIRGHISDTDGALGTARQLISSMQKREVQQKMILAFVAFVLVAAISAVFYYSFR